MTLAEFLQKIRGINLVRPLNRLLPLAGEHTSRRLSPDLEAVERRPFVPGDDLRFLDWKNYGRSDRMTIKLAPTPSMGRSLFLLDNSASMIHPPAKLETARLVALILLYLSQKAGDRIRYSLIHPAIHWQRCRNQHDFTEVFSRWQTTKPAVAKRKRERPLAEDLAHSISTLPSQSNLVVASDLYLDLADLKACLRSLRTRRVQALFVHVLDHSEMNLEQEGQHWQDSESGRRFDLFGRTKNEINAQLRNATAERKEMILSAGFHYTFIQAGADPFLAVRRFAGMP